MKRGTPQHPKLMALAAELEIPRAHAGGILEFIWHFVARYTPNGAIGRYSNVAIAQAIDHNDNADMLVEALVSSGWLDRHNEHRLIVHDWREHAEDSVHMLLARRAETFADGYIPKLTRLSQVERTQAMKRFSELKAVVAQETHDVHTKDALPKPKPKAEASASAEAEVGPSPAPAASSISTGAQTRPSGSDSAPISRVSARMRFMDTVKALYAGDDAQRKADRTSATRLFDDNIWPTGGDDDVGSARYFEATQLIELAKRNANGPPMAYLTTLVKRGGLNGEPSAIAGSLGQKLDAGRRTE